MVVPAQTFPHRYNGNNGNTNTNYTPSSPIMDKPSGVPLSPKPNANPGAAIDGLTKLRKMILFSEKAYDKMNYLIAHCDVEIAWLGSVVETENCYYVEDVYIFEQEVTGGEAELKGQDIGDFVLKYMEEHGDEAGMELNNKLRFWGHSHVNMGVGPSGTDNNTIKELFNKDMDFFIRAIGNKRGEMKIDLYRHFHCRQLEEPMMMEWLDTAWAVHTEARTVDAGFHEEMVEKVKRKSYASRSSSPNTTKSTGTSVTTFPEGLKKTQETHQRSMTGPSTEKDGSPESIDEFLTTNRQVWWTNMEDMTDYFRRFFQGLPVGFERIPEDRAA